MQVQAALFSLMAHFPESGHNGETLKMVSEDYFEDMLEERVTAKEFEMAVKHSRRKCNFFPKVSDIISSCHELRSNPPKRITVDRLSIPEETDNLTEEEIEQNKQRVEIICKQLSGTLTMEEAIKAQEKLSTFSKK